MKMSNARDQCLIWALTWILRVTAGSRPGEIAVRGANCRALYITFTALFKIGSRAVRASAKLLNMNSDRQSSRGLKRFDTDISWQVLLFDRQSQNSQT